MNNSDVRPSIWYYGLAIIIIILGFITFAGLIITNISDIGNGLTQFVVPGSSDLDLNEPGEYMIFYENQTYFNGRFYSSGENIQGLNISVIKVANGSHLATYPPSSDIKYSFGGRSGRAIAAFEVDDPGIYRIGASYIDGSGPKCVLAAGKGILEGVFFLIITSFTALFGSILIGGAMVLVTYKRRRKAFDKLNEEEL